jgi:hypothetical protein
VVLVRSTAASVVALAAVLIACNGLTGADALGIGDAPASNDEADDPTSNKHVHDPEPEDDTYVPPVDHDPPPDASTPGNEPKIPAPDASVPATDAGSDASPPPPPPPPPPCTPKSVGPRYGTVATVLTPNTWTSRNGILAPNDGRYAHTAYEQGTIAVSGFGFAIPASAEIRGITVEIMRTADGSVRDSVSLPKGSAKSGGSWPQGNAEGPYQKATYGGSTDKWGTTWTAADLNDSSFDVKLSVTGSGDGHADSLGVIVHYCY